MKTSKIRRITASALVLALLLPQTAVAAAPAVETDEAVYINLDYYGAPSDTRIVKGVSLNGHDTFTDYGNYTNVYNMSTYDQPDLSTSGAVTWNLADISKQRFYYECIPDGETPIQLPWDFDISYKLNGVSVEAEKCAGASGLIEMNIHAVLNDAASEYYQNNMMLICATGIDMSEALSIDAPGAQIQSMGTYKLVMFMGLPGEENTFTIRIGSDSFESMGLILFMAPATLSSLDILASIKDAKDRLENSGDNLYEGLTSMLDTLDSMKSGMDTMSSGIAGIDSVRRQLIESRGTLDPKTDSALDALEALTGQSDSLIPELTQLQTVLTTINATVNSMLDTIEQTKGDVAAYQSLLREVYNDLKHLQEFLDDMDKEINNDYKDFYQLADDFKDLRTDLDDLSWACELLAGSVENISSIKRPLQDFIAEIGSIAGGSSAISLLVSELQSILNSLDSLSSQMRHLLDTVAALTDENSGLASLTYTAEDISNNLGDIAKVLEQYKGLPDEFVDEGKKLTVLADTTLESVSKLLADIPAMSASLTGLNSTTSAVIDKANELISLLSTTMKNATDLLYETRDTLRSLRDESDKSAQASIDGLLDVLDKAVRSNSSGSLQRASDSIHKAVKDAESDLEDETNVLNIDSSLELQSVTSSQNPVPASVQFILRTKEISIDELEAAASEETAEEDIGVFGRIANIFAKLVTAVTSVFSSEE